MADAGVVGAEEKISKASIALTGVFAAEPYLLAAASSTSMRVVSMAGLWVAPFSLTAAQIHAGAAFVARTGRGHVPGLERGA